MNRQLPRRSKENYQQGQEADGSGYYSGDSDFDSVSMASMTMSSIYHRHIEHFFTFLAGNTVFSLVSESPQLTLVLVLG